MSADELRQAAATLRERAESSGDAPWHVDTDLPSVVTPTDEAVFEDAFCSQADAAYIATVHPGVGLALADWLEEEAEAIPPWATHYGKDALPVSEAPAVRVARLINGGAA